MAVAIDQFHGFKPLNRSHRCRLLQSMTHLDYTILEHSHANNLARSFRHPFEPANIHKCSSTPCLSLANQVEDHKLNARPRVEILCGNGTPRIRALVAEVAIAIASGVDPIPVSGGLGGVYLLHDSNGDKIAVTKPVDEEPFALNNPKGFQGLMLGQPGVKRSVGVGETGIRELAAFLLDHGGFAGIPPAAFIKISHVQFHVNNEASASPLPFKIASLHRFVDHDFDAGELGPSGFSVACVHRIGILDVRLLNLDRHAGNILVKKNSGSENYGVLEAELVPIDHGQCLPEWLDDPYFEWLHWPQASVPFSNAELDYISNLDPFKDAQLLRLELPSLRESSIRVLVLCTVFLKDATAAGLCIADIGKMMTRESVGGEETMSVLEDLCSRAKARVVGIPGGGGDSEDAKGITEEEEEEEEEEGLGGIKVFHEDGYGEDLQLSQGHNGTRKPPKIPRLYEAASPSLALHKEKGGGCCNEEMVKVVGGDAKEDAKSSKGGILKRSMSFAVKTSKCEPPQGQGTCLGDLNEEEFEQFLGCFEMLLPEVFYGRKSISLKPRLGTSCQF